MSEVKTVRIKSSHPVSQGDFVEINESDFDENTHQRFEDEAKRGPGRPRKED